MFSVPCVTVGHPHTGAEEDYLPLQSFQGASERGGGWMGSGLGVGPGECRYLLPPPTLQKNPCCNIGETSMKQSTKRSGNVLASEVGFITTYRLAL